MINHIISKCSKLAPKDCKTRQDCVGNVIHWELSKKLKFDLTNKWYIYIPEPVLENETHKLLWDFEMQTDLQISVIRPILLKKTNKKQTKNEKREFAELWTLLSWRSTAWNQKKLKRGKSTSTFARKLKKPWNMKVTIIPIIIEAFGTVTYGVSRWFILLFGIWLHSGLFYSYPTLSCWFNILNMRAVKELYERRQEEKIRSQDIFYILPLFQGLTPIQWTRKFFPNTNEMFASSSQGVKMC